MHSSVNFFPFRRANCFLARYEIEIWFQRKQISEILCSKKWLIKKKEWARKKETNRDFGKFYEKTRSESCSRSKALLTGILPIF